jgi:hypothetical protein
MKRGEVWWVEVDPSVGRQKPPEKSYEELE